MTSFSALLKSSSRCKSRIRLANQSIDARRVRWVCCFSIAFDQCIRVKISFLFFRQCISVRISFLFFSQCINVWISFLFFRQCIRVRISFLFFRSSIFLMLYIQSRKRKFSRVLHSKRLFQHFLINAFVCVKFNNLNFVRLNQLLLRVDFYRNLMNRLSQNFEFSDIDQKMTILSSNHTKFFRYMKIKKQDVFALIRKFNKLIFFITFICNSHWEKFERNLSDVVDIVNRFDLMIRVFQLKFKKFLRDFIERHVMRIINAHIYVIEFQKRDLSHAHILLIANSRDEFDENNIDDVVHAMIFSKKLFEFNAKRKILYELIVEQMIYKNCKKVEKAFCHDFESKCIKWFLKKKLMMTKLCHHSNLSRYRRFSCEFVEEKYWNNKWMIFYNFWLLQKYETHINVEICINAKLVKYLYKYIFKKNDYVDVFFNITTRRINELRANRQDNEKFVDEIKIFHDARWIEFCETAWRIFDLSFDKIKFAIIRFQLHLKNRNRIVINFNDKKIAN